MTPARAARAGALAALLGATTWACADGRAATGAALFATHCARCHGDNADGLSRLSMVLTTKPPNLRASRLARAEQERMVRLGGEANGRSALMPAWGGELDAAQIGSLLDYLQQIRTPAGAGP